MSIIAHENQTVNTITDKTKLEKWAEKKSQSLIMSKKLSHDSFFSKRAGRMAACCDNLLWKYCPKCGHSHAVSGAACKDRLCPLCEWRLSMARYAQMMKVFEFLHDDFIEKSMYASMLTLTVKNVPVSKLRNTLAKFTYAWRQVSDRKCLENVAGWARNIEITRNPKNGTYHPHVHILLLWEGVPQEDTDAIAHAIKMEWDKQLGIDYSSVWHHEIAYEKTPLIDCAKDAQKAAEAAAAEAAMYTLNSNTILDIPERDLFTFAQAVQGVRMTGYGGIIKEMRRLLGLSDTSFEPEADEQLSKCPNCGEQMQTMVLEWVGSDKEFKPREE